MAIEKVDGIENVDAPQGVTAIEIEEARNVTKKQGGGS